MVHWMRSLATSSEFKAIPPMTTPRPPLASVRLIVVDEADRLRVSSLEQLCDLFDRKEIGLVLIGTPGRRSASPAILSSIPGSAPSMPFDRCAPKNRRLLAVIGTA